MNSFKISVKCAYCKEIIKTNIKTQDDSDKRLLTFLIKDNTVLCKKCVNNSKARIWLSDYILKKSTNSLSK